MSHYSHERQSFQFPLGGSSLEQLDFVLKPRAHNDTLSFFLTTSHLSAARGNCTKDPRPAPVMSRIQFRIRPILPPLWWPPTKRSSSNPMAAPTGELTASTAWIRYVHGGAEADQLSNNCLTLPNCFIHTERAHMSCWGSCMSTDAPRHGSDLCVFVCVCVNSCFLQWS